MTPTAAPAFREPLATDVPWLYSSPGRLFVFVAVLRNTTPRTLDRLSVDWTAYDANGNQLRATRGETVPPIGANATHYFVAGVSGASVNRPVARVTAQATAYAVDDDAAPTPLRGENVQLVETTPPRGRHGLSYQVTTTLTAPATELDRNKLRAVVLLRDATGTIVGADWARRDSYPAGLPAILAPGTSFRFEDRDVPATAAAASAEVIGYVDR